MKTLIAAALLATTTLALADNSWVINVPLPTYGPAKTTTSTNDNPYHTATTYRGGRRSSVPIYDRDTGYVPCITSDLSGYTTTNCD